MKKKKHSILSHEDFYFTKKYITSTSKSLELLKADSLETHFWIYELHSQIQKKAGDRCVLKGGASTQLYLPVNLQRCTNDIDCATDLSRSELKKLMGSINNDFSQNYIYTSYKEYIPKHFKSHNSIPMMTFIFNAPFVINSKRRMRYPGLKIDFLFLDLNSLHKTTISNGETLGLTLCYKPIAIDKYSTISDKLITLASNSLGLERYKLEGLYKNVYDLYCLISTYNDLKSFKIISQRIQESLSMEIEMKHGKPINIIGLLDDILYTTYDIATFSLVISHSELAFEIIRFQEDTLQRDMREMLNTDMWSIMCSYLYIWVFSLKNYILNNNYATLEGINIVLDEYQYYLSLGKKQRRELKAELKRKIKSKTSEFVLEGTGHPLRLMYLDYILTHMNPNSLKKN